MAKGLFSVISHPLRGTSFPRILIQLIPRRHDALPTISLCSFSADSLNRAGAQHEVQFVSANVAEEADTARLVARTLELHGSLDCLVNNALVSRIGSASVN